MFINNYFYYIIQYYLEKFIDLGSNPFKLTFVCSVKYYLNKINCLFFIVNKFISFLRYFILNNNIYERAWYICNVLLKLTKYFVLHKIEIFPRSCNKRIKEII